MDLENIRILKEMRNSVNRKVNCETANINKTVNAAVKQVEDIRQELFRSEVQETVAAMKRMGLKKEEAVALLRQLYDEEERE